MRKLALDKELQLIISGDPTKLKNALGQAGSQVTAFTEKVGNIGKKMTIVGGIVTAAFAMIVKKTADVGDQFDKMSLRTGVSVEALSSLNYAAGICGSTMETVENSLRFMARGMYDTSRGVGEAKEAFADLGVEVTDSNGSLRSSMPVLKEVATKIAAMTNETEQAALAGKIFGTRYGTQLMPLLKLGASGIDELMQKAKDLNITISTEAATAAAEFTDRMKDIKDSLAGAGRSIGEILIPSLTKFAEKIVEIIKKMTEWAKTHSKLIEWIVKIGATLGVLAAVGGPLLIAVSAFMKMKGAIIAVGTALKVVGSLAITNPIGMAIAAAGALYVAWTTNFIGIRDFTLAVVDKVKEALGWLWDKIEWVLEKLGLYKEKIEEVGKTTGEFEKSIGEVSIAVDNLKEENEELATSFDHVKTGAEEATEAIKLYASDVAENYIALAAKSTESWEAFYKFWEVEAARTAKDVIETIEKTGKKIDNVIRKIRDEAGKITGVILPGGGTITTAGFIPPTIAPGAGMSIYESLQAGGSIYEQIQAGRAGLISYQAGIRYVPKTQLALIHRGEEINPPGQRSYDQRKVYSPTININNPVVRNDDDIDKIKRVVEDILNKDSREYLRQGKEILLGA